MRKHQNCFSCLKKIPTKVGKSSCNVWEGGNGCELAFMVSKLLTLNLIMPVAFDLLGIIRNKIESLHFCIASY